MSQKMTCRSEVNDMEKQEKTQAIDNDKLRQILKDKLPISYGQISKAGGKTDNYISNALGRSRIGYEFVDKVKYIFGVDLSEAFVDETKEEKADAPVVVSTPVKADYEPIITAIGQATGILSAQLNELINQLKTLNQSRAEEVQVMQKSITDSMVNAIILGMQESKGIIGDGVKMGLNNSGEIRNAIIQALKTTRRY